MMSHNSSAVVTSTKFHCDLVSSTWLTRINIITLLCSSAPQSQITSSQWSLADVTTALLWWLLQNFTVIWSAQPGLPESVSSHYSAVQLLRVRSHHHNEVWQMSPQLCCGDFYKISLWFGQFITRNIITPLCSSAPQSQITSSQWSLADVTTALLWWLLQNFTVIWSVYHKKYHHTTLQFSSSEPDHIITMKFGRCHHSSAVVTSTKFHCDLVSSTWLTRISIITLLCSSAPQSQITSSQWSLADVTTALLWWLLQNFTVIWSAQSGLPESVSSHYSAVQLLRVRSHHHNEVWQMSPQLCCGDFYKISLWFGQFITRNIITLLCSSAPQSQITSSQWSLADVTTALLWWLLQNFTVIWSAQSGLPESVSSHYSAVQLLRVRSHHHNEVWQMSPQLCCGDFYKISLWFGQFITRNIITPLCSSAPQSQITSSQWSLADVTTALLWWLLQNFTVIWSVYHKKYHHTTLQFSSSEPDHIITMKFGRCHHSSAVVTSTKFHCDLVSSTWLTRISIITLLCSSAPQSQITSSQWSLADVTTALLWWLLQNFTVIWSAQSGLPESVSSHYSAVQLLRVRSHHHNEVWQMSPQLCCGDFYKISLWFGQFITRNIITLLCSSAPQSQITSSQWSLADVTTALLWWLLQNFTVIWSAQSGLPESVSSHYSAVQLLRVRSHHHNEVWQMSPQLCCGDFYKISLWFGQLNLAYQNQYHHITLQFSSSEPDHIITMKFGRCHHSSAVVTSTKFHCD